MADGAGEFLNPSFPSGTPPSPSSESASNLAKEAEKLRISIKELTDTIREKKKEENSSSAPNSSKTDEDILDCLKDMRGHLESLYILQQNASVSSTETKRSEEVELDSTSSAVSGSGSKPISTPVIPTPKAGSSGFVDTAKGIFYIAAAIGALALGLKLMQGVKLGDMVKSFLMIAALGTGLVIFSRLGGGENMKKTAMSLIILAAGIGLLAISLKLFSIVSWGSIIKGTFALLFLGTTFALLSTIFNAQKISSMAHSMITMGGALISLAIGLLFFSAITWGAVLKGTFVIALLGVTMGILSSLFNPQKMLMLTASMAALGASLIVLAYGLNVFSTVNFGSIIKATFAIGLLGVTLGVLSWLFNPMTMGKIAIAMILLGVSLISLSFGLRMMGAVNFGSIIKATIALAAIGITFGIISALFGGNKMIQSAKGMLIFSIALIAFAGALILMNYVNWGSIVKMFVAMVLIMPIFTVLMLGLSAAALVFSVSMWVLAKAAGKLVDVMGDFATNMIKVAIAIYLISKAVEGLTWEQLGMAGAALVGFGLIILGLNYAFEKTKVAKEFGKLAKSFIFLGMGLYAITFGLSAFASVGWGAIMKGAVVLVGLVFAAKIMGDKAGSLIKAGVGLIALGIGLIPLALGLKMFNGTSIETVLVAAAAIALIGGAAILAGKFVMDIVKGTIGLIALSVGLLSLGIGLSLFDGTSIETVLVAAAAVALIGGAAILVGMMFVQALLGALAITALGIALIPLAFGLTLMKDVGIGTIGVLAVALLALGVAGFVLGMVSPLLLAGAVAMIALGAALVVIGFGLSIAVDPFGKFVDILIVMGKQWKNILMGAGVLAILGLALIPFSIGLGLVSIALLVVAAALWVSGDYLGAFGEIIKTVFDGIGMIFDKFNMIIQTTGNVIGGVIDKVASLAEPEMGMNLLKTAGGITAVAAALGLLMGGGAVVGLASSVAGMVGGVASGIGNFFSGNKGGTLDAVQTLGLIAEAANHADAIGNMASEIDLLTDALIRFSTIPPMELASFSQVFDLIKQMQEITLATYTQIQTKGVANASPGIFETLSNAWSDTFSPIKPKSIQSEQSPQSTQSAKYLRSTQIYSSGAGGEGQIDLLQDILIELQTKNGATIINQSNTTTSSTSVGGGGGGGGVQIIPMSSSTNRDSTWRMTQGSVRPAG